MKEKLTENDYLVRILSLIMFLKLLFKLFCFKVTFEVGKAVISNNVIGTINCNFNGLKERIISRNFKSFDLKYVPTDLCVLPNGNILTANYYDDSLSIYDENFNWIKDICKINNVKITPLSLQTNNIDRIYIVDDEVSILMTDLDLVYIKDYDEKKLFNHITFYNDFLYACVENDKCIVKFDSNLKLEAKYYLGIEPRQINIINNIACVIHATVSFYELMDFKIFCQYNNEFCSGGVYQDNFFILTYENEFKFDCFNKNGSIVDSIDFSLISEDTVCQVLSTHNDKLFAYGNDNKIYLF
jgi:hypothetical protein